MAATAAIHPKPQHDVRAAQQRKRYSRVTGMTHTTLGTADAEVTLSIYLTTV
jgi:hypothetical protein